MGIETALIGLGVGAKTAGAIASVASVASTGFSIFSGLSSFVSGSQQQAEAKNQSALALAQAEFNAKEKTRVAFKEAQNEKEMADTARRKQKVAYLASGVTLEGSPLLVMEETRRKGEENINEILMSGAAGAEASRAEGRITAAQLQSSGREAFSSGLSSGLKSIGSALIA